MMYKKLCNEFLQVLQGINSDEVNALNTLFLHFKIIDRYDHINKKNIKKQLQATENDIEKLKALVSTLKNEIAPKYQAYLSHLVALTQKNYWQNLLTRHAKLSNKQRLNIEKLQNYFISIRSIALYRLPLVLILRKLNILKTMQQEIGKIISNISIEKMNLQPSRQSC